MPKVQVSHQKIDENLFIRSEKLKINNKTLRTPIKAINMPSLRQDVPMDNRVKGVNEIFKTMKIEDIKKYCSGEKDETNIYQTINTSLNKTEKDKEVNICFIQLPDLRLPKNNEIDFISNISYVYSDITPLPLVQGLFKSDEGMSDFNLFVEFMQKCIDSINRLNNKPILGVVPATMPSTLIGFLIDFYYDNDITSFAFDFQGRIHKTFKVKIREMITKTLELDISNESFIYSCNTQRGKVSKGSTIIKGNDIAVYNYGFDVMGDSHIPSKMRPDIAKKLKERADNDLNIRLFNTEDYGHYKFSDIEEIKKMYPYDETDIPLNCFDPTIIKTRAYHSQKLFNSERIGLEANKYKNMLNHTESAYEYINTKNQIRDSLDKFKEYRSNLNRLL
ncbi:hypothetical protein [uncultured Methanobrevibacter sp.]|uniref:hypothetical protein n=1 Tax=uncultured Methanobrevibacter sp. TaxID=253161 RepID=UPI0025D297AF|nr:hypothetical protein [uncultured Methanobrevibacter sp.]